MISLIKHLYYNFEPICYAALLTLGFAILIFMLDNLQLKFFIVGSILLYGILTLEIYATWIHGRNKLKNLDIPIINESTRLVQLSLHLTLPSLTYWVCCAFIFSNLNPHFWVWFLIFSFILFALLFINIRAYYENKFKLEAQTHHVYDFIKLMIYFMAIFSLVSIKYSFEFSDIIFIFTLTLINGLFICLNLIRYHLLNFKNIIYVLITSLVISTIIGMLIVVYQFEMFKVIVYTFLVFYLASGIIHHKLHHNLNSKVLIEYLAFALFAVIFTIGI